MADQEQADVRLSLARLRQEHEDYDAAINAMITMRGQSADYDQWRDAGNPGASVLCASEPRRS